MIYENYYRIMPAQIGQMKPNSYRPLFLNKFFIYQIYSFIFISYLQLLHFKLRIYIHLYTNFKGHVTVKQNSYLKFIVTVFKEKINTNSSIQIFYFSTKDNYILANCYNSILDDYKFLLYLQSFKSSTIQFKF